MYPITFEVLCAVRMMHDSTPMSEPERELYRLLADRMNYAFNQGRQGKPQPGFLPTLAEGDFDLTTLIKAIDVVIASAYREGVTSA